MGNMGEIHQNMGENMGNMGIMGNMGKVGGLLRSISKIINRMFSLLEKNLYSAQT